MPHDLHTAILKNQSLELIADLIETAKAAQGLDATNMEGLTALQLAARECHLLIAQKLILAEANIHATMTVDRFPQAPHGSFYLEEAQKTPFDFAFERGHIALAILLLIWGANTTQDKIDVLKAHRGYLPIVRGLLYFAVSTDQQTYLKKLIQYLNQSVADKESLQADINGLLVLAAQKHASYTVAMLLEVGNVKSILTPHNALYWAAYHRNDKLCRHLLDKGANAHVTLFYLYKKKCFELYHWLYNLLSTTEQAAFNDAILTIAFDEPEFSCRLNKKIYGLADRAKSQALQEICENEDLIVVIETAFARRNYVVMNQLLSLLRDKKNLFRHAALTQHADILAILCCTHLDIHTGIHYLAESQDFPALMNTVVSQLWSRQGCFHSAARYQPSRLFIAMKMVFDKDPHAETAALHAVLHHIQDDTRTDLRYFLRLLTTAGVAETVQALHQTASLQHLAALFQRYEFAIGDNKSSKALIIGDDVWSSIAAEYLDSKSKQSLAETNSYFRNTMQRMELSKSKKFLIARKKQELQHVSAHLKMINDELDQRTVCGMSPISTTTTFMLALASLGGSIYMIDYFLSRGDREASNGGVVLTVFSITLVSLSLIRSCYYKRNTQTSFSFYRLRQDNVSSTQALIQQYNTIYALGLDDRSSIAMILERFSRLEMILKNELRNLQLSAPPAPTFFSSSNRLFAAAAANDEKNERIISIPDSDAENTDAYKEIEFKI